MKRLRLQRWSGQLLSTRTRPCCIYQQIQFPGSSIASKRSQSTGSAIDTGNNDLDDTNNLESDYHSFPSPPHEIATQSAKLAALHARLSLPKRLPVQTVARTLVDPSADPNPQFNNSSLTAIGSNIISYHVSELLLCKYPRLPVSVLFASMYAYIGPPTLHRIAQEWGVESAAAPGGEVDPGLLQFSKVLPKSASPYQQSIGAARRDAIQTNKGAETSNWRRGMSSKIIYDDEFGDLITARKSDDPQTVEQAHASFVKALIGSIYIHAGRNAAKEFVSSHILSRHLEISSLFTFKEPTKDLARLCARHDFEAPVARMLAETGRRSIAPVYVVGIFSGKDMLGEAQGASLEEARIRAAVAALKSWYLYSPMQLRVPSEMEEEDPRPWTPVHVDMGEVVV